MSTNEHSGIIPCKGLEGSTFTDSRGMAHDLTKQRLLRPKEAAADFRLAGTTRKEVLRMIGNGSLYPVLRTNARVLLIFDVALSDWRARCCRPISLPAKPKIVRPARASIDQSAFV